MRLRTASSTLPVVVLTAILGGVAVHLPAESSRASSAIRVAPDRRAGPTGRTELPRVRLLATGGTIANQPGARLTAEELIGAVPELQDWARAEAEQFANVASTELTLEDWLRLARRISQVFASDPGLAGVVVTMGTDTLEELAYFLHLTVRDDRPVVVVGAMRSPRRAGYDGAANLLAGFRVAADPAARGLGTLVVLNDEINSAREVTKTDARRLHTFQSRPSGSLGTVDEDGVAWFRRPVKRAGRSSEFDLASITSLPRVDILMVYQQAPADLINAAVDRGARGIVMAAAGAGALSATQSEGLAYAARNKVVVVMTTRTGAGVIWPRRADAVDAPAPAGADSTGAQTIAGGDLLPVKARVLLMLALSRTADPGEIQRIFREY